MEDNDSTTYGFNIARRYALSGRLSDDLDEEWHKVIVARLEADALTTTEKKEMMLV